MFAQLFSFHISPLELILRGTLVYWFLFFLFRFILHRNTGSVGLADILVVVVIADAAQNGMAGEYKSVGEAFLLIATIGAWDYFIDWMSYRYPAFRRFADPKLIPLVRDGKVLRANMRREMITWSELESHLRQHGIEDITQVKQAAIEPDGNISVTRYESDGEKDNGGDSPNRRRPGA